MHGQKHKPSSTESSNEYQKSLRTYCNNTTMQDSREEIYHSLELNLNTVYNKPIQEGLSGGFVSEIWSADVGGFIIGSLWYVKKKFK